MQNHNPVLIDFTINNSILIENDSSNYITFFSILDYIIFISMLAISGLIGLYYGFFSKRKQNNPDEYIFGNREMSVFPIAASLIVSQIAGVTMLGLPADVYANGTQYVMSFISMILTGLSLIYFYVPVFYDLGYTSCFTYLEKRFDSSVKITASIVYTIECILSLAIVTYIPALAFNHVSGINLHIITTVISTVCIFYTTQGGLRAVVWTDVLQFGSIIVAVIIVIIYGTIKNEGIVEIFKAADRGGRLIFFDMDPNPLKKQTFWTICIGLGTMWIAQKGANQATIQRCLSLPTRKKAIKAIMLWVLGVSIIKTATAYIGLILYKKYETCDPLTVGIIKKLDQILPYYIMSVSSNIPGLAGIFISGVFAAGLSSMSSILNALSGTIFEDFIKPNMKDIDKKTTSTIMKAIVVVIGLISLGLVFVLGRLGGILQVAYSLHGLTGGTIIGIFTIGMISNNVNKKGIISGAVISLLCVGTILIGAQIHPKQPYLSFNTYGCTDALNNTNWKENFSKIENYKEIWLKKFNHHEQVPWLFRISFMYYTLIGFTILILIAIPVSYLTGGCENLDEKLLAPYFRSKTYKKSGTEANHHDNEELKELNKNYADVLL